MTTYLRKRQVRTRYGEVSDRSIDRMVQDGRLPKPKYFGGNRIPYWSETELDVNDRAAVTRPQPQFNRLLSEISAAATAQEAKAILHLAQVAGRVKLQGLTEAQRAELQDAISEKA
jgi:predicted DNA-binding transcriptional regulator AlpA